MFEVLLIAISLSADAFAVTISNSLAYPNSKTLKYCPLYFGIFQGVMPLLGFFLANTVSSNLQSIDNIIVFIIFSFIGFKMICDGLMPKKDTHSYVLTHKILIIEAFATSIDALASGFSFCFMGVNIFFASIITSITTFICCYFAIFLVSKISTKFNTNFEIIGGIVLFALGIKSLLS